MLENIIKFIKNIFVLPTVHDELESYIIAGNPQDAHDIDRLERQFYENRKKQSLMFFRE